MGRRVRFFQSPQHCHSAARRARRTACERCRRPAQACQHHTSEWCPQGYCWRRCGHCTRRRWLRGAAAPRRRRRARGRGPRCRKDNRYARARHRQLGVPCDSNSPGCLHELRGLRRDAAHSPRGSDACPVHCRRAGLHPWSLGLHRRGQSRRCRPRRSWPGCSQGQCRQSAGGGCGRSFGQRCQASPKGMPDACARRCWRVIRRPRLRQAGGRDGSGTPFQAFRSDHGGCAQACR